MHHNNHKHHHSHEDEKNISNKEKIVKLLNHWIKHNDDHTENYKKWAQIAKSENMLELSEVLEDIAKKSKDMNVLFEKALELSNDS